MTPQPTEYQTLPTPKSKPTLKKSLPSAMATTCPERVKFTSARSDLGHVFPTDEHDRAWYEENDPQSLIDSLNGNVNCPHNALHKMRSDGLTFTAYRCGNCAMLFEVAEHKDTEPIIERLMSGPRSPWGTRLRQA